MLTRQIIGIALSSVSLILSLISSINFNFYTKMLPFGAINRVDLNRQIRVIRISCGFLLFLAAAWLISVFIRLWDPLTAQLPLMHLMVCCDIVNQVGPIK